MFKFDSSTHLTSPNLEGDLKSAKTHNLLSANPSYNDLPSDSDENICSPLFSRVTNEHRKLLRIKIRKISNSKKNPQFFKILKKPNKNFFLKMKDSISIQNVYFLFFLYFRFYNFLFYLLI